MSRYSPRFDMLIRSRCRRTCAGEGVSVAVYDMRYAKPLDERMLDEVGAKHGRVITVEDGVLRGGVGEAVIKYFNDNGFSVKVDALGIGDEFVRTGYSCPTLFAVAATRPPASSAR